MIDRPDLVHQLVEALHAIPDLPDYLGAEPPIVEPFDPYQMVSEWIALRQEMKQQGKLLQAAQAQAQQELERLQQQLTDGQQQVTAATDLANQAKQLSKDQDSLLRSLLNVMDDLDRACAYWEQWVEPVPDALAAPGVAPADLRVRLANWLLKMAPPAPAPSADREVLPEILSSGRQGVSLIRQNLLDLLKQQQVMPLLSLGQPFDSQRMYAIGRQASPAPANHVIQEVTRGYLWRDRVLREAQVIVSAGSGQ